MATKKAPTPRLSAQDRQWRAQSDLEALTRAQEITADKSRAAAVQKLATKNAQALSRIVKGAKVPSQGRGQ